MSIIVTGASSVVDANPTFDAMRVCQYPIEALGFYRFSVQTGLVTTLAANGAIFAFRNPDATKLVIPLYARVGWRTITGFTAAQEVGLSLSVGRSFSTMYNAGGAAVPSSSGLWKKRNSYPAPVATAYYSSGTAVITGGTVTLDSSPMAQDQFAELAAAATVSKGRFDLLWDMTNGQDNPLILVQNEGLVLTNQILMGAGGTARISIEIGWAEATSYP